MRVKGAQKITEFMHFCCQHPILRQICRKNPHTGTYIAGILSIADFIVLRFLSEEPTATAAINTRSRNRDKVSGEQLAHSIHDPLTISPFLLPAATKSSFNGRSIGLSLSFLHRASNVFHSYPGSLTRGVRLRVFFIFTDMSPKFILLTAVALLTAPSLYLKAQDQPVTGLGGGTGRNIADHLLIQNAHETLDGPAPEQVEGSPYLTNDFVTGDVLSSKGRFDGIEMRYNIYEDVLEFKQNKFTYLLDPSPDIRRVDMGEYRLIVDKAPGNRAYGFYAVLDSGNVTLLARMTVRYRQGKPAQALEAAPTPGRYMGLPDTYYYRVGDGPLTKVTSVKKMIASFPDRHAELQAFASKEKISSRKGDELVRLVRLFNQWAAGGGQ